MIDEIRKVKIKDRLHYLPEKTQFLFNKICDFKRPVLKEELKETVLEELTEVDFEESYVILSEMELIYLENGAVLPHYMKEEKNDFQSRL